MAGKKGRSGRKKSKQYLPFEQAKFVMREELRRNYDERGEIMVAYTSYKGNNDVLFSAVADIYLYDDAKVADITYGKGNFWNKVDTTRFDFHASDLITTPERPYDFTDLPYEDNEFDVVVFDPPYITYSGIKDMEQRFKVNTCSRGHETDLIIDLYLLGMSEAYRILKKSGQLWLKCQDVTHQQVNRFLHIEIHNKAVDMGFVARDLFIITMAGLPCVQIKDQLHARKNHSYLWIFNKDQYTDIRALRKNNKNEDLFVY